MISKLIGSAGFLSSGGTIGGDLTIDGDLTVSGGGSTFAYNEVVTGDMIINRDASGNSAENGVGLYVDFDRTVASSGTAAHNDIGINLDVNSASLGTSSVIGMDIDVVGATSGTSTATGLTVDVGSADTNYAALFNGGNVGINESVPLGVLHVKSADSGISTLDSGGDELVVEGSGSAGISILAGASSTAGLYFPDSGDANRGFLRYDHNTDAMTIRTNNADAVTVNSSGNVGIGVTPEAWNSGYDGLQIGNTGSIAGYAGSAIDRVWITANGYVDTNDGYWQYINTDTASQYEQRDGLHNFFTAVSDSADATISWVKNMVIDANSRISLSNNDGNEYNTVFGYNALSNNGTVLGDVGADYNVAIGYKALGGTGTKTDATNNVGIGYSSLTAITTGDNNIAIGYSSGIAIDSGSDNILIGKDAGDSITTCNKTILIGTDAGQAITVTGGSNVSDGTVAVGYSALAALTSGIGNVAIGYQSMDANQTSDYNTAVGYNTLGALTNDGDTANTAVGYNAGAAVTSGVNNTLIGTVSGDGFDAERDNTFVGYASGTGAINGADYCVAIGSSSFQGAATQDGTVAIGYQSLKALTSGAGNTAVGYQALDAEDAGGNSTAVGYQALSAQDNDTGHNTAVGWTAGDSIVAGYSNTLIGSEAGTTGSNDLAAGIQNTLIGQATSVSRTDATNQTVIGRGVQGVQNNSVTLGDSAVTAVFMAQDSGAKVWCGELDVSSASHAYVYIDSSATSTATWLVHSMGGAGKWMAGMEGGGTEYRIYDASDSSVAVHVAAGGSSWVNDSDERMKKEILPMEDRLSDLMKIKVRRFKWKKNDKEDFGFVAQELESCVPEAVDVGSDEVYSKEEADDNPTATEGELKNPYGVSRELLIPMMIKSIQELTAKVEELEAKLK